MSPVEQKYRELSVQLFRALEAVGGRDLPYAEEARFAGELEDCWRAMTDEEQVSVAEWLAGDGDEKEGEP